MSRHPAIGKQSRGGTVYVAVLGVALIVGVVGICSLHVARLEVRDVTALEHMARARLAARSGLECGLAKLQSNSDWRTAYESGGANLFSELTSVLASDDSFEFTFVDSDGNLVDDDQDAVTLRSIGKSGDARHLIEVLLMPTGQGVSSLSASLHADDDIYISSSVTTNQAISTNDDIHIYSGSGGSITGNAQAGDYVYGAPTGTEIEHMTPLLEMPDPEKVFEYYLANGTPINFNQLPAGRIENEVLSAGHNPYGTQVTNIQGIYVIDCQGGRVVISNARIKATLVFINASAGVELDNAIVWEPHIGNFPAMMVQGDAVMNWDAQTYLNESTLGVNFNPDHTADQLFGSDNILDDAYPGRLTGIVYMTGNLLAYERTSVNGVVVIGGQAGISGPLSLLYDSTPFNDAPPGFGAGEEMAVVPGTWKQVSY